VRAIFSCALVAALAFTPGCKKKGPTDPGPDPGPLPLALQFIPAADVRIVDVKTPTQTVDYSLPTYTGGVPPVTVSCSPGPGAAFSIGTTTVTCNASDARIPPQAATVSFTVTLVAFVPPVPDLSVTKFMAFGDSITAEVIGEPNTGDNPCGAGRDPGPAGEPFLLKPKYDNSNETYPAVVKRLLDQRYTRQTFTMVNEGSRSETAAKGYERFPGALDTHRPEAVLLLQGILDVHANFDDPTAPIEALETDIRAARARGVVVLISTLLPFSNAFPWGCDQLNATVRATNDLIRALAIREGALLVDPYPAFAANLNAFQGADGLHPTKEGQEAIAAAFFDVIKKNLELPLTTSGGSALSGAKVQVGAPARRQPVRIPKRQQ
jgi:lysophospholipase L1-like esterase